MAAIQPVDRLRQTISAIHRYFTVQSHQYSCQGPCRGRVVGQCGLPRHGNGGAAAAAEVAVHSSRFLIESCSSNSLTSQWPHRCAHPVLTGPLLTSARRPRFYPSAVSSRDQSTWRALQPAHQPALSPMRALCCRGLRGALSHITGRSKVPAASPAGAVAAASVAAPSAVVAAAGPQPSLPTAAAMSTQAAEPEVSWHAPHLGWILRLERGALLCIFVARK